MGLCPIPQFFFEKLNLSAETDSGLNEVTNMNIFELINYRKTGTILKLIQDGQMNDWFPELKNYPDKRVRIELVRRGLFLNDYISDKDADVRIEVVKKDVKYLTTLINNKKQADDFHINQYVVNMWHPRVSELKTVKRAKGIIPNNDWGRAYDIKIASLQNKEHAQWAKNLTIALIHDKLRD